MKFKENLCNSNDSIADKLTEIRAKEVILKNFEDSIQRESMRSFIKSIMKKVEE